MFQRLVLTIATAVGLTGLFFVYTLAMRPIVVIPVRPPLQLEIRRDSDDEMPDEYKRVAKTYLNRPEDSWAQDVTQALRADNAFIYTNDWRRDEANYKRIHFKKFAMVWLVTNSEGKEEAYTIVSDSVQLEFDSEIDERKMKNPGRVVKARFEDNVHIGGPNGLEIVGTDFYFDESLLQLETWYPVEIRYQSHYAYARRMVMKFLPGQGVARLDRPHIGGVEFVRLIGGADPKRPYVYLASEMPNRNESEKVPVRVKCAGDLVYTISSNLVVLNEDVTSQIGTVPKTTRMQCDRMTIELAPKPTIPNADGTPPSAPRGPLVADGFQVPNTKLDFNRFVAEGKAVRIHSIEHGVHAKMTRLEYSVHTQVVTMLSEKPDEAVELYRGLSTLNAPRVDVQLGTGIKTTFESLLCLGKGYLYYFDDETEELKFETRWKRHLGLKKDEKIGLHVIDLEEEALFVQKNRATGLSANQIKVWLANLNVNLDNPATGQTSDQAKKDQTPEPKRMVALGNVAMVSPKMNIIETKELDVVIEDGEVLKVSQTRPGVPSRAKVNGIPVSSELQAVRKQPMTRSVEFASGRPLKNRVIGFANVPAEPDQGGETGAIPDSKSRSPGRSNQSSQASDKPIEVRSNRIVARLQRGQGDKGPVPKSIHCEGTVNITQDGEAGKKNLSIEGDIVDLNSEAVNQEVIGVFGKPAVIKAQNYRIEGRDIKLDRRENLARVNGPGNLTLPIPEDADLQGMDVPVNRELRVQWERSMEFDGLQATFLVGIHAISGLMKMHCEQMTVEMVSRMSFQGIDGQSSNLSGPAANPDLKTIRCQENVRFENTTRGLKNKVTGVYRGEVGEFLMNRVTGKVDAQGPGKIRVWERQKKTESGSTTPNIIQANSPIPAEVALWDYTLFEFEGTMKGTFDMKNSARSPRNVTITDRVKVTRGPVERPTEEILPDKLPSMGVGIRCNQLKVVHHPISERNKTEYVELVGTGNAELEGCVDRVVEGQVKKERFQASADEMSYDGGNGNYMLRGNGRRQAMIRGMFNNNAASMKFNPGIPNPKDQSFSITGATEGNAAQ